MAGSPLIVTVFAVVAAAAGIGLIAVHNAGAFTETPRAAAQLQVIEVEEDDWRGWPEPAATPEPKAPPSAEQRHAAERAIRALARSGAPSQWWRGLSPLLTAQARDDYESVDPSTVPFTKQTGAAWVSNQEEGTVLHVPTDAGVYEVALESDQAGHLLVSWIIPVEER